MLFKEGVGAERTRFLKNTPGINAYGRRSPCIDVASVSPTVYTGGHGSSQTPSDPSPTSGLTSTTAQANSCPVHDGDWKLVELSDGSKSYVK